MQQAAAAASAVAKQSVEQGLKPRRLKPNFMSLAFLNRHYALGKRFFRKTWKEDCYWILTRIVPTARGTRFNRGKAWGIFVWKGKFYHNGEERRIPGTNKPEWQIWREDIYLPWDKTPLEVEVVLPLKKRKNPLE